MKRIAFNGSGLLGKELYGVQRVTLEILKELDKIVDKDEVEVIIPCEGFSYDGLKNIHVRNINIFSKMSKIKMTLWNLFLFPFFAKKEKCLTADFMLGLSLIPSDIVMIHDCIPELFPENAISLTSKISRYLHVLRTFINVHFSKIVLTVSECSKKDIAKIYKVNADKIKTIHLGWQHFNNVRCDDNTLCKLGLVSNGYFFSLGSRYKHKNFQWVVAAALKNRNYKFVITGTNKLSESDACLDENIPENLVFTGYLSDGEIKMLMKNCIAFIQPSLYEGFGIPPLEAMSVGARCIVSNVGSLPEIYEDSVWYIDPKNYEDNNLDIIMKQELKPNSHILQKYDWKITAQSINSIMKNELK